MGASAKPRKKYRPKLNAPGGGLGALVRIGIRGENASPLRDDQLSDLGNGYWLGFTNLTQGNASEESWSCVVCAMNIAMTLAEQVFDHQHEEAIVQALDGLFRAKIRSAKSGNFRLDGEAMQAVRFGLEIHDQQMRLAHRREIVAAMQTVKERVAAGHIYEAVPA